jgi:predicted 3-demethylubiquinone-9 3-methyltransferase (glyoxalase superfamily)
VNCTTQKEIDNFWEKLTEDGEEGPCGWLKDKFGVSWQVVPVQLEQMLLDPDKKKTERVMKAFMQMKKFDIKKLEAAFEGKTAETSKA